MNYSIKYVRVTGAGNGIGLRLTQKLCKEASAVIAVTGLGEIAITTADKILIISD